MPVVAPAIAVATVATAGSQIYKNIEEAKEAKKQTEAVEQAVQQSQQSIPERQSEDEKMAETIPDKQDTAIQDLTNLVRDLSKTISNTYNEIQEVKLRQIIQPQPQQVVIPQKQEDQEAMIRNIVIIVIVGVLFIILITRMGKK